MDGAQLPYRPCVGVALFNRQGLVWIGRRVSKCKDDGSQKLWQMPQGGIDEGEQPRQAVLRELEEETGVNDVEILAEHPDWLTYDLPEKALKSFRGRYRGQRQKWFALRYLGDDAAFNINGHNGHAIEFEAWRWAPLEELPDLVVPFKRDVYETVAAAFRRFA